MDAFYLLGHQVDVVLFAVSIAPLHDMGLDLSPAVAARIPEIAALVRDEVLTDATCFSSLRHCQSTDRGVPITASSFRRASSTGGRWQCKSTWKTTNSIYWPTYSSWVFPTIDWQSRLECTTMNSMGLDVECYAGRKPDEKPVRFRLHGHDYVVEEVLDQWYGTDSTFYKVRADDGNVYILRQQTSIPDGPWDLVSFRQTPPKP